MNNRDLLWPQRLEQLGVMLGAGVAIDSALKSLRRKSKKPEYAFEKCIARVNNGMSLPNALHKTKCISEYDFAVLQTADEAGRLPAALTELSTRKIRWLQRLDNFNANLLLPKMLLVLGALAGVFVRTFSSGQPIFDACVDVSLILFVYWAGIVLSLKLIKLDSLLWLSLVWRLPFLLHRFKTIQLVFEQVFYRSLTWQMVSGVRIDKALATCEKLLTAPIYKQSVKQAMGYVNRGRAIDESLNQSSLCLSAELKQVMSVANQAGVWELAVTHHLKLQSQVLSLKADDMFKWLPRVYYVIALTAIGKFMVV